MNLRGVNTLKDASVQKNSHESTSNLTEFSNVEDNSEIESRDKVIGEMMIKIEPRKFQIHSFFLVNCDILLLCLQDKIC